MTGALAAQQRFGDGAELIVHQRSKSLRRFRLALLPSNEQLGDLFLANFRQP
jgi:hypothetical protein